MKIKQLLLALLAALIIHPALALANVAYVSNGGESEASGTLSPPTCHQAL